MGKRTEFLYLDEDDMIKAGVLDSEACVNTLDEMFQLLGKGDYIMGGANHNEHGIMITFPDNPQFEGMPANGPDRRFMAMVAYLGGRFKVCGEKWYGSNIINPSRGLPRSVLMVMLNDPDTCEPIALCSGNLISAVRTGSVPGVGVRYLARKDAEVCSVIGAGPIQRACFQGIMVDAKNVKKLVIYDIKPEAAEAFGQWAKETYHVEPVIAASSDEDVSAGDIISVAASRLKPVEIKNECLKKGSTILFTGAATIDPTYLTDCKVFFDNAKMHEAYMEEAHNDPAGVEAAYKNKMGSSIYRLIDQGKLPPVTEIPSLGDVACGKIPGRTSDEDRICMMTGGMPVEDVAWAYELYTRAKEMGLGIKLKIWDSPHWS